MLDFSGGENTIKAYRIKEEEVGAV